MLSTDVPGATETRAWGINVAGQIVRLGSGCSPRAQRGRDAGRLCGSLGDGEFVHSLNLTDIHTTWVEPAAVLAPPVRCTGRGYSLPGA